MSLTRCSVSRQQLTCSSTGLHGSEQNGKLPRASPDLVALLKELKKPRDPFLLYLCVPHSIYRVLTSMCCRTHSDTYKLSIFRKGVIFLKLHKRIEAMDCFITSVKMFPYNWSAWKELSATLDGTSEVSHWRDQLDMKDVVCSHCMLPLCWFSWKSWVLFYHKVL